MTSDIKAITIIHNTIKIEEVTQEIKFLKTVKQRFHCFLKRWLCKYQNKI